MTDRKFTPPTEFPAEYVDRNGNKAVILGRGPHKVFPFIGHDFKGISATWTEEGGFVRNGTSPYDLHDDTPKRITTWHNVYNDWIGPQCSSRSDADDTDNVLRDALVPVRRCVYRIERDEDGGNPEIFVEEV